MQRRSFVLASFSAAAAAAPLASRAQGGAALPAIPDPAQTRVQPEWGRLFDAAQVPGTLVVLDLRGGQASARVHGPVRAALRVSPASTFKIPHSLFALDAGLVRDEF